MVVKAETSLVRPFVVCAVLRGVSFDAARYNSFIDLQVGATRGRAGGLRRVHGTLLGLGGGVGKGGPPAVPLGRCMGGELYHPAFGGRAGKGGQGGLG